MNNQNLSPRATPSSYCLLKNFVKGLPPSYSSLSTHGVPALLGSLAGLLLAGLAEEKSGSMQVFSNLAMLNFSYLGDKTLQYGVLLYSLYPGRTPPVTWTCLNSGLNSTQVFRIVCSPP